MKRLVKIYGERNTNTNYLSKLIQLNLDVVELRGVAPGPILKAQHALWGKEWLIDSYFKLIYPRNLGWKHTRVKAIKKLNTYQLYHRNLFFITITKNPYSWLLSLYRNPYHQQNGWVSDFETFLATPWKTTRRDNCAKILNTPIELWNLKNASYLQLDNSKTFNTTTEQIFESPKAVIDQICSRLSIKRKSDEFVNYQRSTKDADEFVNYQRSTKDENQNYDYYRNYYLKEIWRQDLSKKALAIIGEIIDQDLMRYFGYEVLSSV